MVNSRSALTVVVALAAATPVLAAETSGPKASRRSPPTATAPVKPAPEAATAVTHGDWVAICSGRTSASKGPTSCHGTQLLRKASDAANLAQYRLTTTPDAAVLRLSALVPANAQLNSPVRLIGGDGQKEVASLAWTNCTLGGCLAQGNIASADLRALEGGPVPGASLGYFDAGGHGVNLPLSPKGLGPLLNSLQAPLGKN